MQTARSGVSGGDDGIGRSKRMEEREVKIHGIYKHFKNKYYIVEDREPVAKRTNSRGEFVGESRS